MSIPKDNETLEELHKYREVFPKAWKRFLKTIEEGKILYPEKGQEARAYTVTCVELHSAKNAEPPDSVPRAPNSGN